MNTPSNRLGRGMQYLIALLFTIFIGVESSNAQNSEENDQEDGFFNEIDQENFKSDFGDNNSRKSIDYSSENRGVERKENYDIFGNDNANSSYKFEEYSEAKDRLNSSSGGVNIIGGGGNSSSAQNVNPNNSISPSINDPFKQSQQGVKSPRNIDAVPDNGDDPNDVPLDTNLVFLVMAAAFFGYKIHQKRTFNLVRN